MNVYTYYHPVPGIVMEDELKLVTLWRRAWEAKGFMPIVLGEYQFEQCPGASEYREAMQRLPSVNPMGYDLICYLRWMAMAHRTEVKRIGFGIMSDYDVIPYDGIEALMAQAAKEVLEEPKVLVGLQSHVPSLVVASSERFSAMCNWFVEASNVPADPNFEIVEGRPHTSDMYLMLRYSQAVPHVFKLSLDVKLYTEDGWQTAPAVHYSNGTTTLKGLTPRWKHIKNLRA